jgi:hypothetical protein
MDDQELRKIALLKATETCGGQSTDYQYLLEAAEAIYQWLRHGPCRDKPEQGESIWKMTSMSYDSNTGKVTTNGGADRYEWPVTREEPTRACKRPTETFADGLGVGTMDWPLVT